MPDLAFYDVNDNWDKYPNTVFPKRFSKMHQNQIT